MYRTTTRCHSAVAAGSVTSGTALASNSEQRCIEERSSRNCQSSSVLPCGISTLSTQPRSVRRSGRNRIISAPLPVGGSGPSVSRTSTCGRATPQARLDRREYRARAVPTLERSGDRRQQVRERPGEPIAVGHGRCPAFEHSQDTHDVGNVERAAGIPAVAIDQHLERRVERHESLGRGVGLRLGHQRRKLQRPHEFARAAVARCCPIQRGDLTAQYVHRSDRRLVAVPRDLEGQPRARAQRHIGFQQDTAHRQIDQARQRDRFSDARR